MLVESHGEVVGNLSTNRDNGPLAALQLIDIQDPLNSELFKVQPAVRVRECQ
jgi:hypothetical protein